MLTLDGRQFRDADLILASPPCQRYSYMAMPFSRGKREASWQRWERDSPFGDFHLNDLFRACFRIQREASAAAGRYIPMVVENVKGAQPWVGRAKAHYGSYYLWGDVESIGGRIVRSGPLEFGMGGVKAARSEAGKGLHGKNHHGTTIMNYATEMAYREATKNSGGSWFPQGNGASVEGNHGRDGPSDALKNSGGSWFAIAHNTESGHSQNPVTGEGVKVPGMNWSDRTRPAQGFNMEAIKREEVKQHGSRRAASALIARIPYALSAHIARCFWPRTPRSSN